MTTVSGKVLNIRTNRRAQDKTDTETNFVVTVGFTTKADHHSTGVENFQI